MGFAQMFRVHASVAGAQMHCADANLRIIASMCIADYLVMQANPSSGRAPHGLPHHRHGVCQEVRGAAHCCPEPVQHELGHQGASGEEGSEEVIQQGRLVHQRLQH